MRLRYEDLRQIAAQTYFNWLQSNHILEKFEKPETLATVCYEMGFPEIALETFEKIFVFINQYNLFEDAGGTFKLKYDIKMIREMWDHKFEFEPNHPIYNFLQTGLKLFSDLLEGGTGTWDTKIHHFTVENALTHESLYLSDSALINLDKLGNHFSSLDIGIYGPFPQIAIEYLTNIDAEYNSFEIIVPTDEIRNQIISFCELFDRLNSLSTKVHHQDSVRQECLNLLLVSNGLTYLKSFKEQLKYFNKILSPNGFLYFQNHSDPYYQIGIEPLLELHPNFTTLVDENTFNRTLKTTGFSKFKHTSNGFGYVQKIE